MYIALYLYRNATFLGHSTVFIRFNMWSWWGWGNCYTHEKAIGAKNCSSVYPPDWSFHSLRCPGDSPKKCWQGGWARNFLKPILPQQRKLLEYVLAQFAHLADICHPPSAIVLYQLSEQPSSLQIWSAKPDFSTSTLVCFFFGGGALFFLRGLHLIRRMGQTKDSGGNSKNRFEHLYNVNDSSQNERQ